MKLFNTALSRVMLSVCLPLSALAVASVAGATPPPVFDDEASEQHSSWKGIRQFGTSDIDRGYFSVADKHGNLYVTGYTEGDLDGPGPGVYAGTVDIYVMKLNPKGEVEWIRQFGSPCEDSSFAVRLDRKGYVYIAGQIGGDLIPNDGQIYRGEGCSEAGSDQRDGDDAFVMKLDGNGNMKWLRQFGTADDDANFGLDLDSRGNAYVTGYTWGDIDGDGPDVHAGQEDVFMASFDPNGNQRWIRQIGTTEADVAYAVAVDDPRGGVYATGFSIGNFDNSPVPKLNAGGQDIIAVRFDNHGGLHWVRQFGTSGDDNAYAIAVDHNEHLYLSGYVSGDLDGSGPDLYAGDFDLATLKIRKNGDLQWTRQLGTPGSDFGLGVAVGHEGSAYMTGTVFGDLDGAGSQNYYGLRDVTAVKFAEDGDTQWIRQWGTPGRDWGFHIATDEQGLIRITGQTGGDLDGPGPQQFYGAFDIFVLKFREPGLINRESGDEHEE